MAPSLPKGCFITFEGPELAGKSTQINRLAATLTAAGHQVLCTREPGGTVVGERLRDLVKHLTGPEAPCSEAELFIFAASRVQLIRQRLLPHLAAGGVVLCDRYADSTTAYQGYGRGVDLALIAGLNATATTGRWPDLTLLLDLTPEAAERRRPGRAEALGSGAPRDRFEEEAAAFHARVRAGYLTLAAAEPARWRTLNADQPEATLAEAVAREVQHALARLR